jgi:YbbR domain-containing protein
MLRKLLFEDIQYKVVSLIVGFLLWSAVNFGTRASLSVEREVELKNTQDNYVYKLSRKKVRIKVSFVERLVSEGALENIQPFVDVRGLNTGRYLVKVEVRNPYKFLVSVDKVEPEKVEVIIQEAPQRGER